MVKEYADIELPSCVVKPMGQMSEASKLSRCVHAIKAPSQLWVLIAELLLPLNKGC